MTLFLPVHSCGSGPMPPRAPPPAATAGRPPPAATTTVRPPSTQVPLAEIYNLLGWGHRRGGPIGAVWTARTWYPYLLLPVWLVALALCAIGARGARVAGIAIFLLTAAILALEVAYVGQDFGGILPAALRPIEVLVALIVVVAILGFRPRGRSLLDAEAGISAQALLSALHAFTFIGNDVRIWSAEGAAPAPMFRAVFANYLPAFWVATAALLVAAAPAYLARPPRVAGAVAPAPSLTREPASPSR